MSRHYTDEDLIGAAIYYRQRFKEYPVTGSNGERGWSRETTENIEKARLDIAAAGTYYQRVGSMIAFRQDLDSDILAVHNA